MILCIKYTSVFFKGIYTSGNSRTAGLVRPNIQKKITDYSVHEMMHIWYKVHECILQRNLYFRELTYRRTGSPEHPKENTDYSDMRWYYAYLHSVFFKGIYTSGNSRTAGLVRPNIQKKITDYSVHEMILCILYNVHDVFFKGIYTSGNSRTAGLVRPNIQKKIWIDYSVHEKIYAYIKVHWVYFSKESILQGTHVPPDWFARTSKRK